MAEAEGGQRGGKRKKGDRKGNKIRKIPKILGYLFQKDGLAEKKIGVQAGGYIMVNDFLDIYSDFTEEDLYDAAAVDNSIQIRECPHKKQLQIKMCTVQNDVADPSSAATTEQPSTSASVPRHFEKMSQRHVRLSKYMSYILRHGAEKEVFKLQPGGFVYVDELLQKRQAKDFSMDDVNFVVANNEKQRFYMETDPENQRQRIRANQGHTLPVKDLDLKVISNPDEYPVVVHGTYRRFLQSIKRQGLSRMKRNHIHMATGQPGESEVISGMRGTCDVIIYIDLKKAMQDGIEFYLSPNNVILTSGDEEGLLKPKYFVNIKERDR